MPTKQLTTLYKHKTATFCCIDVCIHLNLKQPLSLHQPRIEHMRGNQINIAWDKRGYVLTKRVHIIYFLVMLT